MDIQELRREAQTMQPQLTADRRRLHRNPEAGAVLPETVAYVITPEWRTASAAQARTIFSSIGKT